MKHENSLKRCLFAKSLRGAFPYDSIALRDAPLLRALLGPQTPRVPRTHQTGLYGLAQAALEPLLRDCVKRTSALLSSHDYLDSVVDLTMSIQD